MATIVHENDGRLDVVEGIARDAARDAAAIVAAAARRKERSWTLEVLLIGVLASQVLQLIGAHL